MGSENARTEVTGTSPSAGHLPPIAVRHLGIYALLIASSVVFLLPLVFMISSSLKPDYQVLDFPRGCCRTRWSGATTRPRWPMCRWRAMR